MEQIDSRIRSLMTRHGMSENELARRTGIPQPSINRILNGRSKSPRRANLIKIAEALGTTDEVLLGRKEYPTERVATLAEMMDPTPLSDFCVPKKNPGRFAKNRGISAPPVYAYPAISWLEVRRLEYLENEAFVRQKTAYYSAHEVAGMGFWLTMQGDAMAAPLGVSPTLPENTLVLFDTGETVKPGKIVLAFLQDSAALTCRLLIEEGGQRFLKPLNLVYPLLKLDSNITLMAVAIETKTLL